MNEILYQLRQVAKDYQGRRVVEIDELDVRRGEILAIVGPSGSGKSTLLRLMNFLEAPDQGRISYHEADFSSGKEMPLALRRQVTMVFQQPMLLNGTVWDNVAFGLRLRGERDSHAQILSTLDQVGLGSLTKQRARTLSGGEAQRVALARAMVIHPEVLLLDEPTANLDPYNVGLIESIVRQLNEQQGVTIVMVTHNVFQAKRLAQRVVFLLDGKIVEVGNSESFFENPSDPRTSAFVNGEMVY